MQKIVALTVATIATLTFAGACNVEEVDAPDSTGVEEDPSLDETYTQTVVDLDQGGKIISQKLVSKREQLERAERRAELEALGLGQSQEAIVTVDSDCTEYILISGVLVPRPVFQMWGATNFTGNSICLVGNGVADLGTLCQTNSGPLPCPLYWAYNVESFKVSLFETTARFVQAATSPCVACTQHSTSQQFPDADLCEEGARYLLLDQAYSCPL